MSALINRFLAWLCERTDAHVRGRCPCPLCDTRERAARAAIGIPARHPERITRDMPGGQEEVLASLAATLWPADEYTAIITKTRRDRP